MVHELIESFVLHSLIHSTRALLLMQWLIHNSPCFQTPAELQCSGHSNAEKTEPKTTAMASVSTLWVHGSPSSPASLTKLCFAEEFVQNGVLFSSLAVCQILPVEPPGPGFILGGRFWLQFQCSKHTVLFRWSISSWVSFGRFFSPGNLSIWSKLSNLLSKSYSLTSPYYPSNFCRIWSDAPSFVLGMLHFLYFSSWSVRP